MAQRIKKDYLGLVASGMFWEFHPELTGNWEKDKDEWIFYHYSRKMRNDYTRVDFEEADPSYFKKVQERILQELSYEG